MSEQRREQALALLGLHVSESGRQPHGPPPDDEELALLIEGGLDPARRAEVLSHVAADPRLYRQLLTLTELQTPTAAGPAPAGRRSWLSAVTDRLHDWRISMATGALGGATAAAVAAAALVWQSGAGPSSGSGVELVAQPPQRQQELAAQGDAGAHSRFAGTAALCERLTPPDAQETGGRLCVLSLPRAQDDPEPLAIQHWLWIREGSTRAWLQRRSGERPLALRASGDGAWIALHAREGDGAALQVHAVPALRAGRFEPVVDLALGGSGVSDIAWREGQLEFVSRRDFADDPANPRILDEPRRQRIRPDSGAIERIR